MYVNEFIDFLQLKLKPPQPIEFELKATYFIQYWHEFITYLTSYLEEVSSELASKHSYLLNHIPTVALVPRGVRYVVFVRSRSYDDIYLAYNTAYVFSTIRKHYYVVPYIHSNAIDSLVKNKINPSVIEDVAYILPVISSVPCTNLIETTSLIKDYLTIKAQSYMSSGNLALTLLGFLLIKLISGGASSSYEETFSEVLSTVINVLRRKGFYVTEKSFSINYMGFPVTLYVLHIQ